MNFVTLETANLAEFIQEIHCIVHVVLQNLSHQLSVDKFNQLVEDHARKHCLVAINVL